MRDAFYVTTALLSTNSIRTASDSNQLGHQPTSHHDDVVPGSMDTESSLRRLLRGSRKQHDRLALSAVGEERTPEALTRIFENSLTLLSKEALDLMRKAAHSFLDLNALPEESLINALEAHNIVRSKDPRTSTASNVEVSSSQLSKKRSMDKASGSGMPKKLPGRRPKKMRTIAALGTNDVQRSINHGMTTPMPSAVSKKAV